MNIAKVRVLLFCSAITFACCTGAVSESFGNTAHAAGDATRDPAVPPPCGNAVSVGSLATDEILLNAHRVGNITAQTPAREAALSTALAGLEIEQRTGYTEGSPYPIFYACLGREPILIVVPSDDGYIHAIVVVSARVRNAIGPAVGSRFEDVVAPDNLSRCSPGEEELSGKVFCTLSTADNVTYVFSGAWNGPDGEVPPGQQMRNWILTEIRWLPPFG